MAELALTKRGSTRQPANQESPERAEPSLARVEGDVPLLSTTARRATLNPLRGFGGSPPRPSSSRAANNTRPTSGARESREGGAPLWQGLKGMCPFSQQQPEGYLEPPKGVWGFPSATQQLAGRLAHQPIRNALTTRRGETPSRRSPPAPGNAPSPTNPPSSARCSSAIRAMCTWDAESPTPT